VLRERPSRKKHDEVFSVDEEAKSEIASKIKLFPALLNSYRNK
jgi:hypothetical protein